MRTRHKYRPVHPPIKLFTPDVSRITCKDGSFFFLGERISKIELAGYIFRLNSRGCYLLDFFGTIFIHSNYSLGKDTCKVICSLAFNGSVLCRGVSFQKISFYEEVFFWKEAIDYKKRLSAEHAQRKAEAIDQ